MLQIGSSEYWASFVAWRWQDMLAACTCVILVLWPMYGQWSLNFPKVKTLCLHCFVRSSSIIRSFRYSSISQYYYNAFWNTFQWQNEIWEWDIWTAPWAVVTCSFSVVCSSWHVNTLSWKPNFAPFNPLTPTLTPHTLKSLFMNLLFKATNSVSLSTCHLPVTFPIELLPYQVVIITMWRNEV